jgi:hypothetical protein
MATFNIEEYLNSLPDDVEEINISYKGLTYIPSLERFTKLQELICSNNQLTTLVSLPSSLQRLYCSDNQLGTLPPLSSSLQILECWNIQLTYLPSLPSSLQELYCGENQLTYLPPLPSSLKILYCEENQITSLPYLPSSLQELYCYDNELATLPILPSSLQEFYSGNDLFMFYDISSWRTFDKFRKTYYKLKYGHKLERYFLNVIKKKKQQLNNELLYSPNLKFYKQFVDPITLETMKTNKKIDKLLY